MKPKVYVVSLPNSPKRESISERLAAEDISFEWIDGVIIENMADIPHEERDKLEAYCIPRLYNDPVYVCRAVGCKRAMQNAIKMAATCTDEWVIILQDDAYFIENFIEHYNRLISQIPEECGVVMLHYVGGGTQENERFNPSNYLRQVVSNVRRMTAFAVRPSFAPILDNEIALFGGEEDRIWEILHIKGHLVLAAEPQLVYCNQKGSDIIGGIPELEWLWA